MKCPHCSKDLSNPNLRFCPHCGKKLPESAAPPPPPPNSISAGDIKRTVDGFGNAFTGYLDKIDRRNKNNIPQSIMPDIIHPCNDERPVKQYNFMEMRFPFIKYIANGVLQITNKRIIYTLLSKSRYGSDRVQSEFSIDDVSSITVGKTTTFNFLYPILYFLFSPTLLMVFGLLSTINQYLTLFLAIIGAVLVFYLSKTTHYNWLHILAAGFCDLCIANSFYSGGTPLEAAANAILQSFNPNSNSNSDLIDSIIKLLMIYFLIMNAISYFKSIFHTNINVVITSKSGAATPIVCSQNGILSVSHNLLQSLCIIEPTPDTEIMTCELGAMVSDIQKMGDYGIEKWTVYK